MSSIIRKSDSSSVIVDVLALGIECLLKHSSLGYSRRVGNSDNSRVASATADNAFSSSSSSILGIEELISHVIKLADPKADLSTIDDKAMYLTENTIDLSHVLGLLELDLIIDNDKAGGGGDHLAFHLQVGVLALFIF